jgi:hypothetical protein
MQELVDLLRRQRAAGETDFDAAWRRASLGCSYLPPINGRREQLTLEDADEVPLVVFYREACRKEWHGHATADYSALRSFSTGSGEDRDDGIYRPGRLVA